MREVTKVLLSSIALGLGASQCAHAELALKGLPHPVNGFPTWFKDTNGVALQLCLDGQGTGTGAPDDYCIFDAAVSGNAFSQEIGFGAEAFWWLGDTSIQLTGKGKATLVMALEAAFNQGAPAPGDQFAFSRVRIRVDTPVAGTYKVWHPLLHYPECQPEVIEVVNANDGINVTRDIGGGAPFTGMMNGDVGPFLVWNPEIPPAAPAGYVGDPAVEHQVVGSRCGESLPDGTTEYFNYFKIEGPAGANLGGSTGSENIVRTDFFNVMGKIFNSATTQAPLVIDGATFYRTQDGSTARVNVWAQSDPDATVTLSGLPGMPQVMLHEPDQSDFFKRRSVTGSNAKALPLTIKVKAEKPGTPSTEVTKPLADGIDITGATYTPATASLKVIAVTTDKWQPRTLTARAGARTGEMVPDATVRGKFSYTFTGLAVPPPFVVVTSDLGGMDTEVVAP